MRFRLTTAFIAAAALAAILRTGAVAQTITLGETGLLGILDSGNAGLLLSQGPYHLNQTATIQSLSFYVVNAAGQLRLGIYTSGNNNNCEGGSLIAQTNAFNTVANSWNTANVITNAQLPIGNYCLAYEPSNNSLSFRKGMTTGQSITYYSKSFGTFPSIFSSNPSTDPNHWSFYATLQGKEPTLSISFAPPNPSAQDTSPGGTIVAKIVPSWSDGSQFTGTLSFGAPYFSDGGIFAIDGSNNLIVRSTGPGLSGDAGTAQNVTVVATQ